jgi:hypothetical protein
LSLGAAKRHKSGSPKHKKLGHFRTATAPEKRVT